MFLNLFYNNLYFPDEWSEPGRLAGVQLQLSVHRAAATGQTQDGQQDVQCKYPLQCWGGVGLKTW